MRININFVFQRRNLVYGLTAKNIHEVIELRKSLFKSKFVTLKEWKYVDA